MAAEKLQIESVEETSASVLEKRLDSLGWGLFLIMMGGLWLAPKGYFSQSAWLIGMGVIILTLTVVRFLKQTAISGFWVFCGIALLSTGMIDHTGIEFPLFSGTDCSVWSRYCSSCSFQKVSNKEDLSPSWVLDQ